MIDDIGKVITAVQKVQASSTSILGKMPSIILAPLRIKAKILAAMQKVKVMMVAAYAEMMSSASKEDKEDKQEEKKMEGVKKTTESVEKKCKEKEEKKKKKKKEPDKSKIDKVLKNLDELNKQIEDLIEESGDLTEDETKIDKKIATTLADDKDYSDELAKIKDAAEKLKTKRTELFCKMARLQGLTGDMNQVDEKSQTLQNKANQVLARVPPNMILTIDAIKDYLLNLITGIETPDDENFKPSVTIEEIKKLIQPVKDGIEKLPVPEIPGLKDLSSILDVFKKMEDSVSGMSKDEIKESVPDKPKIPSFFIEILEDIASGIGTIVTSIPMALINLIFQMIDVIVQLFDQIAGVIGVPSSIPYPLSLIKEVNQLVPDVVEMITMTEIKVKNAIKGIIKDKLREMQALQFPPLPETSMEIEGEVKICKRHQDEESGETA